MKRLLIPLFLSPILLASCSSNKYPSFSEAKKACEKWEENRIRIISIWEGIKGTFPSKNCKNEKETRQILGWEFVGAKEGKLYSPTERTKLIEKESVTKRFYY